MCIHVFLVHCQIRTFPDSHLVRLYVASITGMCVNNILQSNDMLYGPYHTSI